MDLLITRCPYSNKSTKTLLCNHLNSFTFSYIHIIINLSRNNVQESTTHSANLRVYTIFNCVMLAHDLLASVMCLNLPNLSTVLTFVNYVVCLQGTGTYCISYCNHHFTFQFYVYFVHSYILNICLCLYFNYFIVF
jgi:hypothetical protein